MMNRKILLMLILVLSGFVLLAGSVTANENNFLSGSEWAAGKKQYVQFLAKGKVAGSGGCNRFFGTYKIDKKRLHFGPLASTKKACSPSIMKSELKFFGLFDRVRYYSGSHLKLKVFDANDRLLLTLRRRDWD